MNAVISFCTFCVASWLPAFEPSQIPKNGSITETYAGPGAVYVLDTGDVVVFLGNEIETNNVLILRQSNVVGRGLAENQKEFSIGSAKPDRRRYAVRPFKAAPAGDGHGPESLERFEGELRVTLTTPLDEVAPVHTLELEIAAEEKKPFVHRATIRTPPPTAIGETSAPLRLVGENLTVPGPFNGQEVTCMATCSNGSGSITCPGREGCYAFCHGGVPKVGCGRPAHVE